MVPITIVEEKTVQKEFCEFSRIVQCCSLKTEDDIFEITSKVTDLFAVY